MAKYANAPGVEVSRIEVVDHVSTGASVFDAVGKTARYDYIVASHVIEHTTDMLGFLKDCQPCSSLMVCSHLPFPTNVIHSTCCGP